MYPGGTIKCFYVKRTFLEIINIYFSTGDLGFLLVAEFFSERLSIVAAKIKLGASAIPVLRFFELLKRVMRHACSPF